MSEAAQALLSDAFKAVEVDHETYSHRLATSLGRSAERAVTNLGRADAEKALVSGAAIAGGVIVAGALTGGVAIGAVIAIGGAAYAIKKGIERYHSYERNAELRQRWILLGSEYTRLSAEEQAKKRTKLCEVTSADAKDCIRKCVVHLRKALDHYNSALKTPPVGEALTCDDAVTRAKPIFKFIHEYDKFRSYLLPNLLAASTMIEDYHKMSIKWRQTLREVELKLGTHMVRNSHSQCTVCYNRRTAPAAAPARTAAQFDIVALAAQIPEMFNELVAAVAVSKTNTRSGGAGAVSGNAEKRWKKFRDDLLRRYDEPSRGRQVRHFVANRNLATDPSEKVAFAVGQLLDVGSAAGSPFMAGLPTGERAGAAVGYPVRQRRGRQEGVQVRRDRSGKTHRQDFHPLARGHGFSRYLAELSHQEGFLLLR
jgi:hypothetical protein